MLNCFKQLALRTQVAITTTLSTQPHTSTGRIRVPVCAFQDSALSTSALSRPPSCSSTLLLTGLNERTLSCPMYGGLVVVPSRGMKIKGRVKRRCKDCQLVWENGVIHNRCKTHPRHTQKQQEKYWANARILEHATSGFKRPW